MSNASIIHDRCPLPSQLQSKYDYDWQSKPYEWSNRNAKTASLQLVLSW